MDALRGRALVAGATLAVRAADEASLAYGLDVGRALASERAPARGPMQLADGTLAWVKASALSPSGARRHGLRRRLGGAAPHEAEFEHLRWLAARLVRVPEPLFAATLTRGARLLHQVLATRPIRGAAPFDAVEDAATPGTALAVEFGRELGRMHALGFLHADVYPRNVLVAPPEHGVDGGRRLVWLDCWAGGPGHRDLARVRPLARDLGTWFSADASRWPRATQAACLGAYFDARLANGRPVVDVARFLARVVAERRRELRRLERQPTRLRGAPFPLAGWEPAGLLPEP